MLKFISSKEEFRKLENKASLMEENQLHLSTNSLANYMARANIEMEELNASPIIYYVVSEDYRDNNREWIKDYDAYLNNMSLSVPMIHNNIEWFDIIISQLTVNLPNWKADRKLEFIKSEFKKRNTYFGEDINSVFHSYRQEIEKFKRIPKKGKGFTLLWDCHGSLQSEYQCNNCGGIVHMSDDCMDYMSDYRLICPECNCLDSHHGYSFIPHPSSPNSSTKKEKEKWIYSMIWAKVCDGEEYMGGDYSNCRFKLTWREEFNNMRFKGKIKMMLNKLKGVKE